MNYGDMVRKIRQLLGFSQWELAMVCDVSQSEVSRWEHNVSIPNEKAKPTIDRLMIEIKNMDFVNKMFQIRRQQGGTYFLPAFGTAIKEVLEFNDFKRKQLEIINAFSM